MHNHLEFLAYVARADGEVAVEEVLAIRAFMSKAGMTEGDVERMNQLLDPTHTIDFRDVVKALAGHSSAWGLFEAIRDAYVIAQADGRLAREEIKAVDSLFDMLKVPGPMRGEIHRWAAKAAMDQLGGMNLVTKVLDNARRVGIIDENGRVTLGMIAH